MSGIEGATINGLSQSDIKMTYDIVKRGVDLYKEYPIKGKIVQVLISAVVYFKQLVKMDDAQSEVARAFNDWKSDNISTSVYEYKNQRFILVTDFDCLDSEYDPETIGIFEESDFGEIQIPYVTNCSCFLKPIDRDNVEMTISNGYWFLESALKHLSESGVELKSKTIFVTIKTDNKTGNQILEKIKKETEKKGIPYPPITPSKLDYDNVQIKIPIVDYSIATFLLEGLKPKFFGKF